MSNSGGIIHEVDFFAVEVFGLGVFPALKDLADSKIELGELLKGGFGVAEESTDFEHKMILYVKFKTSIIKF